MKIKSIEVCDDLITMAVMETVLDGAKPSKINVEANLMHHLSKVITKGYVDTTIYPMDVFERYAEAGFNFADAKRIANSIK